ncbi:MAG: prepilin-type N-terminal cleavage/methylation domain-containing protein [Fimbriimonadales bacterium]|nr:prepilin-type N-terminal cleavage/methylation domain-containing protein [Fimbriimonadales bacterium]
MGWLGGAEMKYRRQLGLTLMEVLVAVTVIMVTMSLVYLVGRKVKWMSYEKICTSRMMKFSEALMVYRAEWGNVEAEIGDAPYLGFPSDSDTFLVPGALRIPGVNQASDILLCPVAEPSPIDGSIWSWRYFPQRNKITPREDILITFQEATEVMRGATPVVLDPEHNPYNDRLDDPGRPHRFLWISLDGTVHAETLAGMTCGKKNLVSWPRACELHWWVKWYDEEAWRRLIMRPRG